MVPGFCSIGAVQCQTNTRPVTLGPRASCRSIHQLICRRQAPKRERASHVAESPSLLAPALSAEDLARAFNLFNEASGRLAEAYRDLEQQVERLSGELEVANGALRQEYRAKAALSERLTSLLDALPGGVVVLDEFDVVVELNPTARRLLSLSVMGIPWRDVEQFHLTATATQGEWLVNDRAEECRLHIISGVRAELSGRILLITDVTQAHDVQQQLERHKRLSSMGEMAAGLAHQLRTPLASAILYAGNLAREKLEERDRLRFAGKALERLRALERMIQDMLLFLRGAPVREDLLSMAELLDEAAQSVEPQFAQSHIKFELRHTDTRLKVRGNAKTLTGVIVNLLENAMHACAPGGRVSLSASSADGEVLVEVEDNGGGMDAAVLERLFEPFFTTRGEGTGLGLAIVQSVMRAHGGRCEVRSELGRGSRFTLHFPSSESLESL